MHSVARLEKDISRQENIIFKQKSDVLMNDSPPEYDSSEGNGSIGIFADP